MPDVGASRKRQIQGRQIKAAEFPGSLAPAGSEPRFSKHSVNQNHFVKLKLRTSAPVTCAMRDANAVWMGQHCIEFF